MPATIHNSDGNTERFWNKYISKTISYGISNNISRWYVIHSETYIKAHKKRLSMHLQGDMTEYLNVKYRNSHLENWQLFQMVCALEILFV